MSEETIPQMRERIKALEKENGSLQDQASKAIAENRRLSAREAFRTQGYDPAQGDLFAASTDGDIDADAINEFASKFNLKPVASEQEETPAANEGSEQGNSNPEAGLESMSGGSSGTGSGGQQSAGGKTMTRQEYNQLQQKDPVAAREAVKNSQVQLRSDNPWLANR